MALVGGNVNMCKALQAPGSLYDKTHHCLYKICCSQLWKKYCKLNAGMEPHKNEIRGRGDGKRADY